MENLHYKEIKKTLIDNSLQTNMFEIYKEGVDGESMEASIQVAPTTGMGEGQVWFTYPFEHEPLWLLNEAAVCVPKEFTLGEWEKEEYCIFELDFTIENIEETITVFLSKLLDVFYGKPNKTLHVEVENLGGDSDGAPFDHELHDLFSDAGINVGFDTFSNPEKIIELKKIAESELFKELALLNSKIKEIDNENDFEGNNDDWKPKYREQTIKKLPLLKQVFYKQCQLYSNNEVIFLSEETEESEFSEWHYPPIKTHFDFWKIDDYKQMIQHYRDTFNKPKSFAYLDERLADLEKVIKKVSAEPGIERKNLYKSLELNGRSYGSIITNVLVDNGLIMEEQIKSKRMLYPSS